MQETLKNSLSESQMVLVGIGLEMQADMRGMEQDPFYLALMAQIETDADRDLLMPYLELHYLRTHLHEGQQKRLLDAYNKLAELLKNKSYFIVTLCTDDIIYASDLDKSRIVSPCGGYRSLICAESDDAGKALCRVDQELLVQDEELINEVMHQIDICGGDLSKIDFPVCAECTKPMTFNRITGPAYREEEYLEMWGKYMKWLQNSPNRNLTALELGAGLEYAMVIRFPFEKTIYFNRKGKLFRINSGLYQMAEEVGDRGYGIKADPVEFLLDMM